MLVTTSTNIILKEKTRAKETDIIYESTLALLIYSPTTSTCIHNNDNHRSSHNYESTSIYSFDGTDVQEGTYVLRGLRVAIPTVTTLHTHHHSPGIEV